MALRIKAFRCIGFLACMYFGAAFGATYNVRHDHLRGGATGTLTITDAGLSFKEEGKHADHSREWRWTDIQQLALFPDKLSVLTYEDQKWHLGRDREYIFTALPKDLSATAIPLLRAHLDQRLIEAVAEKLAPLWEAEARLQKKFSGADGTLAIGSGQISFAAKRPGDSRTWHIEDIDSISSSGPYDLTITAYERARLSRADRTDFHFQLKERLPEMRYDALWRRVNEAKGLKDLNTLLPTRGEHHEIETR